MTNDDTIYLCRNTFIGSHGSIIDGFISLKKDFSSHSPNRLLLGLISDRLCGPLSYLIYLNSHRIIYTLQPLDSSKANEDLDGTALRGCARPRGLHSLSSRRSFYGTTPAWFIGQGEGGLGGKARLSRDNGLNVTSASASSELQHQKPSLWIIKRAKYSHINIFAAFSVIC